MGPTLFVTGLAGYLGVELAARASAEGWRVAGTTFERPGPSKARAHRVDVRDRAAIDAALEEERPSAVIHTAYRRDDRAVTLDGARHVAQAAAGVDSRLIHMSTDLVFGGHLGRPLTEEDPPDPVLDYGRWKADAEEQVRDAHPQALIVRTSLIYGEARPSDHEKLALTALARDDIAFFNDELRNPVEVGDLADALLELAGKREMGLLHVAGAEGMDRLELARLLVAHRGKDPSVLRGANGGPDRPKDCRLNCSRAEALLSKRVRGAREVLA